MSALPWNARIYVLLLAALTICAVLFSFSELGIDVALWTAVLLVALGIAVLDAIPIDLYGERVEITLSSSVKFAATLLCPSSVVILGTFVGTLAGEVPARRPWFKKVFNLSVMTITWFVVTEVYQSLRQPGVGYFDSIQNVFAFLVSGCTDFVINSVLVALVIAFAMQLSFRYVFWQNNRQIVWHELTMIPLGVFLAVLWSYNPVSVVLAVLPLFVVRHSHKIANELQGQTQEALRALVRVIDERDHHTMDHSEFVSQNARLIAETLGLPQEEVDVIAPAALLHDLGKVGMADDILFNPKVLNPAERSHAQRHAEVGAMLLLKFPLFQKGANLVRHHHERYDGKGYPDGLKGNAIPLGSRIISVADAYQAMTEERPYRHALSQDEAISQLLQGSGTQFDPQVVQVFVRVLRAQTQEALPVPTIKSQPAEA